MVTFPVPAGSWTTETVDSAVFLGGPLSVAYGPIDRHPSLAYQGVTSGSSSLSNLKFAHWDGARWVIEVIGPINGELELAYNPSTGQPAVAYSAQLAKTKYGLVLATRSPTGTWTQQTVELGLSSDISLAYDRLASRRLPGS